MSLAPVRIAHGATFQFVLVTIPAPRGLVFDVQRVTSSGALPLTSSGKRTELARKRDI